MGSLGWVLVSDGTSGPNRSTLAAVRALASAGYRPAVTLSGDGSMAAVSRFCDRTLPIAYVDDPGYAKAIRAETSARPYVTVLLTSDAALQALQAPGHHLVDKVRLAADARAAGLDVPSSRPYQDIHALVDAADELEYPCVVKPALRTQRRHMPARRVDTAGQLRQLPRLPGPLVVQRLVEGDIHSVAGVVWRGQLKAVVHQAHLRIWPPQCGDACYAVTTAPAPALERSLLTLLGDYEGIFQAEFVGPHLLDLNPRVYGSLPLSVAAGVNLVGIFCDLLRGVDVPPVRARDGVVYHWWEGDVRHVASRWRAGESSLSQSARALRLRDAFTRDNPVLGDPRPSLYRWGHVTRALGRAPWRGA